MDGIDFDLDIAHRGPDDDSRQILRVSRRGEAKGKHTEQPRNRATRDERLVQVGHLRRLQWVSRMLTRDEQLGQIVGLERCKALQQTHEECRPPEDLRTREASRSELADAGVAGGLAQLLAARFPDQRMMREHGRLRPPEDHAHGDGGDTPVVLLGARP